MKLEPNIAGTPDLSYLTGDDTLDKEMRALYHDTLGPIERLLNEPDIVEVARLPDRAGAIKVRRLTERGMVESIAIGDNQQPLCQSETNAQRFTQRISFATERSFTSEQPELRTNMPLYGYRLTALMHPLTRGIFWTVRRRIVIKTTLEEYVARGQLSAALHKKIINAIRAHARFAIVAPQSVGKTVLATAILRATAAIYPDTFFLVVEDAWEIDLDVPMVLYVASMEERGGLGPLIPTTLRTGAKSISVGEMTSGAAAFVESWTTGVKRTSVMTIHGDNPENAYLRVEQIQHKEGTPVLRIMNQKAITHVITMEPGGPQTDGLPLVTGLFRPTHLDEAGYFLSEI